MTATDQEPDGCPICHWATHVERDVDVVDEIIETDRWGL